VTQRTERDRIISVQYLLSSMGYLTPQRFSGRLGDATVSAIKAFQRQTACRKPELSPQAWPRRSTKTAEPIPSARLAGCNQIALKKGSVAGHHPELLFEAKLGEQLTSDAVDLRIGERLTSLKRAESARTESGHLRISRSNCPLVQGVAVRCTLSRLLL
jgi:Putative peptidoglycan binding domain